MAVSIEDILLARAIQDQQSGPDMGASAVLGAGIGGTIGLTYGGLAHRLSPTSQKQIMPPRGGPVMKPGVRMAGGLVGAILGGALGAGAAEAMKRESPAGELLAKLQVQGELNSMDQQALQSVLADTYNNVIGM